MAPELSALAGLLGPLLAGHPVILAIAVALDLAIGDPTYRWHPIRLMGGTLTWTERGLRRLGADGYVGGILLFVVLAIVWVGGLSAVVAAVGVAGVGVAGVGVGVAASTHAGPFAWLPWLLHAFLVYSLLALGDLLRHVWRVERALVRDDIAGARVAIASLVGRDTAPMDAGACRRAAIESLSENLADGFTSPLFWYALAGLPGLVLFKVASTMDSMVGYKTPQYLRFGWCGARLDDVMNYVPARLTWLVIAALASMTPGCSARKAFVVGLRQHAILPGPNSGWSEAATAGGIQRRLVGPIWMQGRLVTDVWLGDAGDPPAEAHADVVRASRLVTLSGLAAALLAAAALVLVRNRFSW